MKHSKLFIWALNVSLAIVVLAFSGCGDDEDDPAPNGITVNAGPDQTVDLGETVNLAGTATDASGGTLVLAWVITSSPVGSLAVIPNPLIGDAIFVPDAVGVYTLTLTATNLNGDAATDDVLITVEQGEAPEVLPNVISANTTLVNRIANPSLPDYIATSNVRVDANLTVEPGVLIAFAEDVSLSISSGNTAIIANGTSSEPITFTSQGKANGLLWKGIYVASGSALNSFDHVIVEFAGNSNFNFTGADFSANIGVEAGAKVSVTNSTITNSGEYGLYIEESNGQLDGFGSNVFNDNVVGVGLPADEVNEIDVATTFSGNAMAAVEIFGSRLAANTSATWQALNNGNEYRVTGNVDIDGELTLSPGLNMVFDEDRAFSVFGALIAAGTANDRISFTTSNMNGGLLWKGIYINSASSLNELDYVDVSFAGNSAWNFTGADFSAAVGVEASAKLAVRNSTITDNADYGLYIEESAGQLDGFESNHFENNMRGVGLPANEVDEMDAATTFMNNSVAEVEIFGSTHEIGRTSTWQSLNGDAKYRVSAAIRIAGELTIAPGASFIFDEDVSFTIDGALIAKGTTTDRIVMTTSNVAGGILWKGIFINSSSNLNEIDFADISYAGNSNWNFTGADFAAIV
ncbi:MAG: hypothetical protein AAF519_00815, partial [Bacteroidota bacterium]